jgi:hypothetical protein
VRLLRNSFLKWLFMNEFKSQGGGGFLECVEFSGVEMFFIILQPLADIGFAMFDETIDDACQFVCRGRDAFCGTESGLHAAGKAAQSALIALQRTGR